MSLKYLCILALITSQTLLAADPVDVLFDRQSTYEQRMSAQAELGKATLTTFDSSAELCYGIDLCAQETTADKLPSFCEKELEEMKKHPEQRVSSECYAYSFRKNYQCLPTIPKLSNAALATNVSLLEDVSSIYTSRVFELLVPFIFKKYPELSPFTDNYPEMFKYLQQHPELNKSFRNLTDGTLALAQYTMNCYEKINPLLYRNDRSSMTRYFSLIKSTIDSMMMLPTYKGKVNRGTKLPEPVLKEHLKVGNVVCNKGFTSTAVHHDSDYTDKPRNSFLSSDSCSHRLYITYEDNGAAPGRLISNYSASPGENEVLFEPGACFRIDQVKDQAANQDCGSEKMYDFEMTLVPSIQK